jgi:integrase/recombinase XerD
MGQLRDRMEQDLKLRGLSPRTQRNYLLYCRKFAAFFMRSPEELGAAEVRAFLLHQIEVEQLAYASYRQVYAALKFLYSVTLGRPGEVTRVPFPRRQPSPLPRVLSAEELTAFFAALRKPKYRALFTTCYAAGLRLSEVCHLQVPDIDSKRMVLHVRTSAPKGRDPFWKILALPLRGRLRITAKAISCGAAAWSVNPFARRFRESLLPPRFVLTSSGLWRESESGRPWQTVAGKTGGGGSHQ